MVVVSAGWVVVVWAARVVVVEGAGVVEAAAVVDGAAVVEGTVLVESVAVVEAPVAVVVVVGLLATLTVVPRSTSIVPAATVELCSTSQRRRGTSSRRVLEPTPRGDRAPGFRWSMLVWRRRSRW